MMLGPGVMYWFETSLTFILAIAIMTRVDWRLAMFAVLPAPAVSLAVIFFGPVIHDRFERIQEIFSDISSRVQENLAGVRMGAYLLDDRACGAHATRVLSTWFLDPKTRMILLIRFTRPRALRPIVFTAYPQAILRAKLPLAAAMA